MNKQNKLKTRWIFDPNVACLVGVDEAIMYNNLKFWCGINMKNKSVHNYHEGTYWTYNSVTQFCEIFPFWSPDQIKRILRNLLKSELIIKGRYNRIGYDKTNWYAIVRPKEPSTHSVQETNPLGTISQPIPDN